MTEKKTSLPSLRNENGQKVRVETVMIKRLLPNIQTGNITEIIEPIYARAKQNQ